MASRKELVFFLLDVGPSMQSYLDDLNKMLFNFCVTRLIHKPSHEIAILPFGTTDARNDLYDPEDEGCESYSHISVYRELCSPDLELVQQLKEEGLPRDQQGHPDFMSAMFVAMDMLIKAAEMRPALAPDKLLKTFVVISDNLTQVEGLDDSEPVTDDGKTMKQHFVDGLQSHCIKLEFVSIDVIAKDAVAMEVKRENKRMIEDLLLEVRGSLRHIQAPAECLGLFKSKEVAPVGLKANFTIGSTIRMQTRVYKKAGREKPPSLKRLYEDLERGGSGQEGQDGQDRQYRGAADVQEEEVDYVRPSNPDDPVDPSTIIHGYRYGREPIPIDRFMSHSLKYQPDKCFELIAFVDQTTIPRHNFIGDPSIVLPELDDSSQTAMSALVQAMQENDKAAVARIVQRANGKLQLVLLTPRPGTATIPASLTMVNLPFAEDVRTISFPPLDSNKDDLPNKEQMDVAMNLVRSMDLMEGSAGRELLKPEETPNPSVHHFYWALGCKALDKLEEEPDDQLFKAVFEPPLSQLSETVPAALRSFAAAFTVKAVPRPQKDNKVDAGGEAGAPAEEHQAGYQLLTGEDDEVAPMVSDISDGSPLEDFAVMLRSGNEAAAITAMCARINDIVDRSVMDRSYPKALDCVSALRNACRTHTFPKEYNTFLKQLVDRYKGHAAHAGFVDRLAVTRGSPISALGTAPPLLQPITHEEVPSSSMSTEDAAEFVRRSSAAQGPTATQAAAAPPEVDDDFDDME